MGPNLTFTMQHSQLSPQLSILESSPSSRKFSTVKWLKNDRDHLHRCPLERGHCTKSLTTAGLQITVGHRTLADQNLLMSDEIPSVVGHIVHSGQFFDPRPFFGNNE